MKTGEECKVATTSIWSVKGWLGKVVIYVENPDKTTAPEIAKLPGYEKGEAAQSEEKIQSLSDVIGPMSRFSAS